MADRLGIFICGCGSNIGGKISVSDLAVFARKLPEVAEVQTHALLCSTEGRAFVELRIRQAALDKVVVAGCSPREHENTFRKVLEKAGLNPFQLQMANLREQCAWVHPDPEQAASKARALLQAAVWRVREHEPIAGQEMAANPDVLVVGAGVAGLSAARSLSGRGRRVHLVEQAPFLGGKTVLYEKVFPGLECGSCLLSPLIDGLLQEDAIEVHLLSEVTALRGAFGHFQIRLRLRARGVDPQRCLGCGTCEGVCPVRIRNEHLLGMTSRGAIYLPFPGAQPGVAVLDRDHCLRTRGENCQACREACPAGAVSLDQEDQALEIEAGAVVLATGFEPLARNKPGTDADPECPGFFSGLETEICFNRSGPTGGRLLLPGGREPEQVGILSDPGWNREETGPRAANLFLGSYLKLAHQIREQLPRAALTFFYQELSLSDQEAFLFFQELAQTEGLRLVRLERGSPLRVTKSEGRFRVEYRDGAGAGATGEFDLIVAAEEPGGSPGTGALAEWLHLSRDEFGFWETRAHQLEPVNTAAEGVYAAGAARGPRDIPGAVLDGQAAAGQIMSRLVPGQRIALEPLTAWVETEHCSGCRICLENCPFLALEWERDRGTVRINEALCRGCGLCAVICPSGVIHARFYEDRQVVAEIKGLLRDEVR